MDVHVAATRENLRCQGRAARELLNALKLQLCEMRDDYFGVENSVRELGGRVAGSIKPRHHATDAQTVMSLLGICTFYRGATTVSYTHLTLPTTPYV